MLHGFCSEPAKIFNTMQLNQVSVCPVDNKRCVALCRVGDCIVCDTAVPWGVHLVPTVV